jgi:glycosyltransferase involved in cell wall biosynthesis
LASPVLSFRPIAAGGTVVPSVDIFIPNYNYARFLPECVRRILSEGLDDLRVVIIDNASTDDSVAVAKSLARREPRVELVRHERNMGAHYSYNEAIDRAEAEYFMILCADDLLTPGSIRRGVDLLEALPRASVAVGATTEMWDGEASLELPEQPPGGDVTGGNIFIEECCGSILNVPSHALFVRTSIQKSVGHYREHLPFMDDLEMVLRLAARGAVARMHAPIAVRRLHAANISKSLWEDRLAVLGEREAVFRSFFDGEGASLPNAAALHERARQRIAEAAFWSAASHFVRGRRSEALRLFRYGYGLSRKSVLLPIGHLLRTEGALRRVAAVLSSAAPQRRERIGKRGA